MERLVSSAIGILTAAGLYLVLRMRTFPVILGMSLLTYAVNVFLFTSGRVSVGAPPVLRDNITTYTDPLPQALVLTAIVISMAVTLYLIGLMRAKVRDLGSVEIEPALADDEGREPAAVAAELEGPEGAR